MNPRLLSLLGRVAVAFGIVVAVPAHSALLVRTTSFSPNDSSAPLATLRAFDPGLGSLNRAVLEISGTITANYTTLPQLDPQTQAPQPYFVNPFVTQTFDGLGAFSAFSFSTPAEFLAPPQLATGAGNVVTVVFPFRYEMSFTSLSNQVGFVIPAVTGATTPPSVVNGTLDMFLAGAGSSDLLVLGQTIAQSELFNETLLIAGTATMSGAAILTFDYTAAAPPPPPPPPPPTQVPAPPTLALLLVAAPALFMQRRRLRA